MLGNQWRRWAGFTVASAYELTFDRELQSIRNACALIDISPLYKYSIHGKDALRFLNRLVTRDIQKMSVGQMAYSPWCNAQGKVVDDGTIARLSDTSFRLTAAESNHRWLRDNAAGFSVTINDESESMGALSLQGPTSRALLESLTGANLSGLAYHHFTHLPIAGHSLMVSRTGYTGDLGYEIWVPASLALPTWDALVSEGKSFGLQPCGIWAMDVCRIEAGLIMLDVDYTPAPKAMTPAQASSPFELGLGWAISLQKDYFLGKSALAKEKLSGPSLSLVGLEVDHVAFANAHEAIGLSVPYPFLPWREVKPVFSGFDQVGTATTGTWSPTLKKYVALAQVAPSVAKPGTMLSMDFMVDRTRRSFSATVTRLPFFNPERKRA